MEVKLDVPVALLILSLVMGVELIIKIISMGWRKYTGEEWRGLIARCFIGIALWIWALLILAGRVD